MKISILGTGYVGLVTGACLAEVGHTVNCIDIDPAKIETLKLGKCPIYEPGLEDILKRNIEEKRLTFSLDTESARYSDAVFLAVGTPENKDGSANLTYLYQAIDSCLPMMNDGGVFVIKSTVPVGTSTKVKLYIKEKTTKNIYLASNPEFLKEGAAVEDFMKPERIIIGFAESAAGDLVEQIYEPFQRQSYRIIKMSNLSAEMTKYSANCFLATKISFMNEVARLCDLMGADVEEVRTGISSDSRIGTQFLYPGPGYGGSCFPKDVKALSFTAKEHGYDFKIINAVEDVNSKQKNYMAEKVLKHFNGDVKGKTFAIWGLAFKANTDDVRETPAINTVEMLVKHGAKLVVHDPQASHNFVKLMKGVDFKVAANQNDALKNVDGLIVLTEWKQYRVPDFEMMKREMKSPVIFDGRNLYNTKRVLAAGFKYYAVGKRI
jgi:UDPglucose 6-dehydrogenase